MPPIPIRLPLPSVGAFPIDVRVVVFPPINVIGTVFMFVEVMVVTMMPIVNMVAIVVVLGWQIGGANQRDCHR